MPFLPPNQSVKLKKLIDKLNQRKRKMVSGAFVGIFAIADGG